MKIKTKLLIFGISIVALLTSYQSLDSYNDYRASLTQIKLQHTAQFQKIFERFLKEQYLLFGLGLTAVLNNEKLMKLFAERKREELYEAIKPYHEGAIRDFHVEHFHFHLAPATSFLRVHLPNKFGDDLSSFRLMVVETNRDLKPRRGLEVGREGLRLRLIYPAFYQKQPIGSLEISGKPLRLAQNLKQIFGLEFAVAIKEKVFEKAQRFQKGKADVKIGDQIFYAFSSEMSSMFVSQYQETQTDYLFENQLYTTYKIPLQDYNNQYIGDLLLIENIDPIQKAMWNKLMWHIVISVLMAVFVISLLSFFITKAIHNPLQAVVKIAEQIATGDLNIELKVQRHDEIGRLLVAMQGMANKLRQSLCQVQTVIEEISTMSFQLKQTAEHIALNSSLQTSNLEETNQMMLYLTTSIAHNTENTTFTFDKAQQSAQMAEQGGKAIADTTEVMSEITDRINLVREIAYRTRLLALNAAIEASKAGEEQGRGFSVVAAEVRKLSDRSHHTAESITELTDSSQKIVDYARNMFDKILPQVRETAQLVETINQNCHAQHSKLSDVNQLLLQLEKITHQNLAASEQLASVSTEMNAQAKQLSQLMNYFVLTY